MFKKIALFIIHVYQVLISPFTGGRAACRFTPTCSEYTKQAIKKYGVIRGGWMGARRISRCRPGGGFGFDPVP
jgi:uncharacterized protein